MNAFAIRLETLWEQAVAIWIGGGWAMLAIAGTALVMFTKGMAIHFRLRAAGHETIPEKIWRRWIGRPEERRGPVGDLLDLMDGASDLKEAADRFEHLRATCSVPFERDLRVMKVCVSAAPLLGLLGTVTGMLATFGALAAGAGGDETMGQVAEGISEALITTETGLVVALPGLFLEARLRRRYQAYRAFLAHLENVCAQRLYRRIRKQQKHQVERQARELVAMILFRRLRRARAASAG